MPGLRLQAQRLCAYRTAPNAPQPETEQHVLRRWRAGAAPKRGGGWGGTGGGFIQHIVQGELVPAVHAGLDVQLLLHQDVLLLHVGVDQRHLRSRAGPLTQLERPGCRTLRPV